MNKVGLKAIVHIGTEKTGTSSIQFFLRKNRKLLIRQGYYVLQSAGKGNNWKLPAFCASEERFRDFYVQQSVISTRQLNAFKKDFLKDFEDELRALKKDIHTVVISSEHFHSRLRTDTEVHNLQKFLCNYFDEIKIVCYLREQADTCASWYSTSMKSGSTYSFYDFIRRCRPESYYYNYADVLSQWERHFGFQALDVAIFSLEHFRKGDLLEDFVSRIAPEFAGTLDKSVSVVNESIQPVGQALSRALNIAFPRDSKMADTLLVRDKCKAIIAKNFTGKGQQIDFSRREDIYHSFSESNEKVRQRFFPNLKMMFPPPAEKALESNKIDGRLLVVLSEIFDVFAHRGAAFEAEAYDKIWPAILISLRDILSVSEAVKQGGKEVILSDQNARTLLRAAKHLEWSDIEEAEYLAQLAAEVNSELPGLRHKLASYRAGRAEGPKLRFMMTFHGATSQQRSAQEEKDLAQRLLSWASALETPHGGAVTRVADTSNIIDKEQVRYVEDSLLKGYAIFKAETLDKAIEIAQRCPHVTEGGRIEVFQLQEL